MPVPRISAIFTGLAYLALGVTSLTGSVPDHHWGTRGDLVNLFGLIGFAANVVALELLRRPLDLGRVGQIALRVAQVGLVAMVVESVSSQIAGGQTALGPVFFIGLLLTLLGLLVVAIDGLRHPGARWVAPLPFVGLLVGIAGGEHGGFLVPGVVWIVLGAASIGQEDSPTVIPAAVSRVS